MYRYGMHFMQSPDLDLPRVPGVLVQVMSGRQARLCSLTHPGTCLFQMLVLCRLYMFVGAESGFKVMYIAWVLVSLVKAAANMACLPW